MSQIVPLIGEERQYKRIRILLLLVYNSTKHHR